MMLSPVNIQDLLPCKARGHEGRATGIPKIIHVMKQNGSPPADFEFDEDYTYFMVRLPVHPAMLEVDKSLTGPEDGVTKPKSKPESRPESRPEWEPDSMHYRIMQAIHSAPLSRSEIAKVLGHRSVSGAAKSALAEIMDIRFMEYTIPDKPNSRLQQYRLTEKGRAWLVTQKRKGKARK